MVLFSKSSCPFGALKPRDSTVTKEACILGCISVSLEAKACCSFLRWIGVSLLLLVVSSCCPHVDERPPSYAFQEAWHNPAPQPTITHASTDAWWEVFGDQKLNAIVQEGLETSPTIEQALARFEQAVCLTTITRADQYPQLALIGYGDRRRVPKDLQASASVATGEIISPTTPTPFPVPNTGVPPIVTLPIVVPGTPEMKTVTTPGHVNDLIANFLVSYEVDFWGKYYLTNQASQRRAEEAQADFATARLLLADQIAATYFAIQAMDAELVLIREEIALHRELISLLTQQCAMGLTNVFSMLNTQATLETKIQDEQSLVQSRDLNYSLLAVLVGREPNDAGFEIAQVSWTFPIVPAGLPSSLLAQRPDVRSSMKEVDAVIAEIGAAKTELLPSISLSAAAGYQAGVAHEWFKWKDRIWSIAASVSQPLFDAGKRFAEVDRAKARFREAASVLTQTVLSSVKEVEDALVAIKTQRGRQEAAFRREDELSTVAMLRSDLYTTGVQDYLGVLQAKEDVVQAKRERVNEDYNLQLSTLALMKSVGGSWCEPVESPL